MKSILFLLSFFTFISCNTDKPVERKEELTKIYIQFLRENEFTVDILLDVKENYLVYESGICLITPFGKKPEDTCGAELLTISSEETIRLVKLFGKIDFKVKRDSLPGMKTSIESVKGDGLLMQRQFGSWSVSEQIFLKEVLRLISEKGNDCLKQKVSELIIICCK